MTLLLTKKLLNVKDLLGISDMLDDHAKALGEIQQRAGLLAGPCEEARASLADAKNKLEMLAKLVDDHVKATSVVSP